MSSIEIIEQIMAGNRKPSRDPNFDHALLTEIAALPDPQARMNALERAIDASAMVDGWESDILVSARPFILQGKLPPKE